MAQTVQSKDGYASVEYQLVVESKTLTFNAEVVTFVDAELKDSVYTANVGLHTFRALDPKFLENVKEAMTGANPVLRFRLGFGSPSQPYWLPWQQHIIVNYYAKFEGIGDSSGHLLVFATSDDLVRMERSNKVLARKGTIAEIVKAIAAENKLDSVVEATDGKFMLYQCFVDDTRFIRKRLLPRAVTAKGRGGFYFYIRDNVLHFHTPDYQTDVQQMNYYDVMGTALIVEDISQNPTLWDSGIAGLRVIAQDPYTAETQEIESNPDNALRLADSIYQFGDVNNGQWNMPYHLSFNPPIEVTALAQFQYAMARQKTFQCNVSVDKTIVVRHGDLLNLGITQQNQKSSSYSGYYYVTAAAHVIKKQAVNSTYTLERGEFRGQSQNLSVQAADQQIVQDTKAPGQDPNIIEAQSSEVTKGAGKQSSARTFTVVADANLPIG